MPEFRLTQISDTHLARRMTPLIDNFHRVSEHIDAKRPDLVVNSGDVSFDSPTAVAPAAKEPVTEPSLQAYRSILGDDRWRFDAAGWCFIGLNSLIMNT